MSALSIATEGLIPLCPLSAATLGYIACDGDIEETKAGGKKKYFSDAVFNRFRDVETADDIKSVITGLPSAKVEKSTSESEIDYEVPMHSNPFPALFEPKPLDYFVDPLDRELAILLRIAEIKRHALIERLYAEELMRLEEELAVLLLLA